MSDQQQHLLAFVQDGSVDCATTGNPIVGSSSSPASKRQLRLMKALRKSHTLGGTKQTEVNGKPHLKTGTSLERQTWKLNYEDFLPIPLQSNLKPADGYWEKSENFQKLVDRANSWLKKNVGVQMKSCETITCTSHDKNKMEYWTGNESLSSRSLAEGSMTYFARGLRLWLGISHYDDERDQQLSFFDIVPEVESRISDLVVLINKRVNEKHIKGKIISLDTIACPLYKNNVHSTATRWFESIDQDCPNAYILRVFFLRSSTRKHSKADNNERALGIKDFQPKKTKFGYESFELLMEKANNFMKQQLTNNLDLDICSLQSVLIYRNQDPSHERGPYCYFTTPGLNALKPIEIFRVLRLCYIVTPSITDQPVTSLPSAILFSSKLPPSCKYSTVTYETFVPEFRRIENGDDDDEKERLEMMDEVLSNVTQFLQTYDTEVICAETVVNPIQMFYGQEDMRSIINRHHDGDGDDDDCMFFIFTFRLFLTSKESTSKGILSPYNLPLSRGTSEATMVQMVHPHSQQPHEKEAAPTDKSPNHAPLFLRNVVGRQFKYRWLVLALSAFTCMTIIVAVSVVYSNK